MLPVVYTACCQCCSCRIVNDIVSLCQCKISGNAHYACCHKSQRCARVVCTFGAFCHCPAVEYIAVERCCGEGYLLVKAWCKSCSVCNSAACACYCTVTAVVFNRYIHCCVAHCKEVCNIVVALCRNSCFICLFCANLCTVLAPL